MCVRALATACSPRVAGPVVTSTTTTVDSPSSSTTSSIATTVATTTTTVPATTTTGATGTTTEALPLAGATIVIDPGHNGKNADHPEEINRLVNIGNGTKPCNTTGTATADGYTEAEFNWDVATQVVALLRERGAEVILTRPDIEGWGPCITERAAIGNRNHAHAVISIHADGGPDDGRGFHVIHPANVPRLTDDIYEASFRLARALHTAYLATSMPVADYIGEGGFSERDDLGGLNLSNVPAVFLEAGNMRSAADVVLLTDPEFQIVIADAIVAALISFLAG